MASVFSDSLCVGSLTASRRSFVALSLLAGVGAPVLAGCDGLPGSSKGGDVSAPSDSSTAANGSASASGGTQGGGTQWQELDAHIMGHNVAVRVSPVIRKDEATSIMALELTRAEDDASIDDIEADSYSTGDNKLGISHYLGAPSIYRPGAGASLVKLLDPESGRVWSATDGGGGFLDTAPGEKVTSYLSFGKVDTGTVTVLVPMAGFTAVSVLEADDAKKAGIDLTAAGSDLDQFPGAATELAGPAAIERYTRALDDSTSTHTDSTDVTVTLASDVTFAPDSADLAPGAEAQLQTVAGRLAQYPDGGTLTIVGHTDDIQDDAYNQALSEKRANAVKTRLEQLAALDKWQTSVSGKGESEPRVNDTTDEARAANRRVEITLTPTSGTTSKSGGPTAAPTAAPSSDSGASLPAPQGPTAAGPDGVTLTSEGADTSGEVTIALDHVTRAGGFLLGAVTCTVKPGSTGAPLHPLLQDPQTILSNQRGEEGALPTFYAGDGLTLIAGGERIFPADYLDAYAEQHIPLTELNVSDGLKAGTTTICVVWPDPGGDTITLDHPDGKYALKGTAYRLTDIPVTNG